MQAVSRDCDGSKTVVLTGGTLNGIVRNDNVSFELGTGTVQDQYPGQDKPVTTDIKLTGSKAGNYTLKQPEGLKVSITPGRTQKVDAKPATATENGNIQYWYCPACQKFFSDDAHTKEITLEDTVIPATGKTSDDGKTEGSQNPGGTAGAKQPGNTPQTDDAANLALWIVLMALAAGGLAGIVFARRQRRI